MTEYTVSSWSLRPGHPTYLLSLNLICKYHRPTCHRRSDKNSDYDLEFDLGTCQSLLSSTHRTLGCSTLDILT